VFNGRKRSPVLLEAQFLQVQHAKQQRRILCAALFALLHLQRPPDFVTG
jgi:hypothetical protein